MMTPGSAVRDPGTRQIEAEDMTSGANENVVNEKVVSDRGIGGATFAAVMMIIGGTFGFFEGLALIVRALSTSNQPTTGSVRARSRGAGGT